VKELTLPVVHDATAVMLILMQRYTIHGKIR